MSNPVRPETPAVDGLHIFTYYERPEDTRPFQTRVVEDGGPDRSYRGMGLTIQETGNSDDEPWYVLEWSTKLELHEAAVALVGFASQRSERTYYPSNDADATFFPHTFYERAKAADSHHLCIDTDQEQVIWLKASSDKVDQDRKEPFEFKAFMSGGEDVKDIDLFVAQTISPEYSDDVEARLRIIHNFFVSHAKVFYPDSQPLVC